MTYPGLYNTCSNFTDIQRVVIASAAFGVRVDESWVLPGLREAAVVEENISLLELCCVLFETTIKEKVRSRN